MYFGELRKQNDAQWTGKVCELLVYDTLLSDAECAQIQAYLRERRARGTRKIVTTMGDGLTAGYPTVAQGWATQMATTLGRDWLVVNAGRAGHKAQAAITTLSSFAYLAPSAPQNVEIVWLRRNGVYGFLRVMTASVGLLALQLA